MAPYTLANISEEFSTNGASAKEKSTLTAVGAFPIGLALGGAFQTKVGLISRLSRNLYLIPVVFGTLSALIAYKLHKDRLLPQTRVYRGYKQFQR